MKLVDGDNVIEIDSVEVMSLQPKDIVVVRVGGYISPKDSEILQKFLREKVFPRNKVLVTLQQIVLSVVRPEGANQEGGNGEEEE